MSNVKLTDTHQISWKRNGCGRVVLIQYNVRQPTIIRDCNPLTRNKVAQEERYGLDFMT